MAKYNCKNCGGEVTFDPVSQKLKCKYCDQEFDVSEYEASEEKAEEQGSAAPGEKAMDETEEGRNLVSCHCDHCGAEIITGENTAATTCPYCNRPITVVGNLTGRFSPDLVIPFAKAKEDIDRAYTKLCKRSVLTPKSFRAKNMVEKVKGIYVPFWLHSMDLSMHMTMDCKNIRTWRSGDTEYTKTDSYLVTLDGDCGFHQIPTDAVETLEDALMDSVEPFDYSALKPFSAAYLAGFYTQRYDEDAESTRNRARLRADNTLAGLLGREAGAFTTTTVTSRNSTAENEKEEYALFPIWLMRTVYKNKTYTFAMNGQTGKMVGKIPMNVGKLLLLTAGAFAVTFGLCLLLHILGIL